MRTLAPLLLCAALLPPAAAQPRALSADEQRAWLLGQVRLGEALERDDLVDGALERLQELQSDDPEAELAAARLAIRRGDLEAARRDLDGLLHQAPESPAGRQARVLLRLAEPEGRQALQEARLLAASGRLAEARAAYDRLLEGQPPSLELALEYWRLRSRQDGERALAVERLGELERLYPEHAGLHQTLADLLFDEGRPDEARRLLHELAADPQASKAASQREYQYLAEQPASAASVAAWQEFVRRYPDSPLLAEARATLDAQRRLIADPAWQAGQRGLALLEQGDAPGAEAELRRALRGRPEDAGLHGALGLALVRQGRHGEALGAFAEAHRLEQNTRLIDKWRDLYDSTRYWALLEQAESAPPEQAASLYRLARQLRPQGPEALVGLAALAQARGQAAEAESLLLQAYRLEPGNRATLWGLFKLYRSQSAERALAFLDSLPPDQQAPFADAQRGLRGERLQAEAEAAAARGDLRRVGELLTAARRLTPDDPWLAYRLAGNLREQGRPATADAVFADLLERRGGDPQARYAHALYLSSGERDDEALASLAALPRSAWDEGIGQLAARLRHRQLLARAEALRAAGQEPAAIALLEGQAEIADDDLLRLADWARQRDQPGAALEYFQRVLQRDPQQPEARLGRIESWIDLGWLGPARRELLRSPPAFAADQRNARRRLANAWAAVGEPARGRELFEQLLAEPVADDPLLLRDAARLQEGPAPQRALDLYARALQATGALTPEQAAPRDDRALTRASRPQEGDDWLARSLRGSVDTLYQAQNPTLRVQHDFGWRNGKVTPGISDLKFDTTILQLDLPLASGRAFLRAEEVQMDAGRFKTEDDGTHTERFGTCDIRNTGLKDCQGTHPRDSGTTVAVGWQNERWSVDLGHSPLGFTVGNWLGGASYSWDYAGLGWTLTASRRPLTNSLLSYAGAVDPRTGTHWGGVTASGASLGLSYDHGGRHGVWADFGQHWLRGLNVADNRRTRVMSGYYYKLVDRVDQRLRIGTNAMFWHFDKDLGDYSLGQGGYYSPQRWFSVGLPVTYAWRNADWSLLLEGAVSRSWSHSSSSEYYPLSGLVTDLAAQSGLDPQALAAANVRQGGNGGTLGYRFGGKLERRLSDHWVLGGGFEWQHSPDYAPSQAQVYLRYTFEPWQGALPSGTDSLQAYGDFK
ncbi:cellulose synthase complex outer membrane protein BcsC [Azotobacter bryophylli]|uniref:Cellulose synthase complex outer membrane protein BcsC n=1 Tax=Azotobacter bryophylli TaxID=1986537 RepID=A0ABV7AQH8_9GAMM